MAKYYELRHMIISTEKNYRDKLMYSTVGVYNVNVI